MKISLVVPVFNEEETIPIFYQAVRRELTRHEVEIVFINDGSKDGTEGIINALSVSDALVKAISFTRNFGKEPALFAGLEHATGDAVIPIDVDLQDPISVIPQLIERWQAGADVVLAKRTDRSTDGHMNKQPYH
jgi:glycosyltransferase involved in cell wall biosynthesis